VTHSHSALVTGYYICFQAEDGIRDPLVTGVQTCALPIYNAAGSRTRLRPKRRPHLSWRTVSRSVLYLSTADWLGAVSHSYQGAEIGRASCRERVRIAGVAGFWTEGQRRTAGSS